MANIWCLEHVYNFESTYFRRNDKKIPEAGNDSNLLYFLWQRREIIVRGQSYFSRLPKY